jgi:hypothetical protein
MEATMTNRARTEIRSELLEAVRKLAAQQGRDESDVLEDAVSFFLVSRAYFMRGINDHWRSASLEEQFGRVSAWQRERGIEPLSEDEVMDLANEELHAYRRERDGR